jgi:hypothetical protein
MDETNASPKRAYLASFIRKSRRRQLEHGRDRVREPDTGSSARYSPCATFRLIPRRTAGVRADEPEHALRRERT